MGQIDVMQLFSQLLFPIAVAAYLLWERTQALEKTRTQLTELKIAMYLILQKLGAVEDYNEQLEDFHKAQEK